MEVQVVENGFLSPSSENRAIPMSPPLLDAAHSWNSTELVTMPETPDSGPETPAGSAPVDDIASTQVVADDPAPGVEPLPIRVVRSSRRTKSTSARIKGDHIEVRIPAWLSIEDEQEAVKSLVSRLERRRRAAARPVDIEQRAAELSATYELPAAESVKWSDRQTTLWGSCTPSRGTIRISTRLAAVPDWVLDFVILHELTHLVEANHGPRFKALLGRYPLAERAEGFLAAMSAGAADAQFLVR